MTANGGADFTGVTFRYHLRPKYARSLRETAAELPPGGVAAQGLVLELMPRQLRLDLPPQLHVAGGGEGVALVRTRSAEERWRRAAAELAAAGEAARQVAIRPPAFV